MMSMYGSDYEEQSCGVSRFLDRKEELLKPDSDIRQMTNLRTEPTETMHRNTNNANKVASISPLKMLLAREANYFGKGRFSQADQCHVLNHYLPVDGPWPVDKMTSRAYISQFSKNGALFVAAFQGGHLRVYDVNNEWKVKRDIIAMDLRWTFTDTALSPDESCIVYACMSPIVNIAKIEGVSLDPDEEDEEEIHESLDFSLEVDDYPQSFGIFSIKFSTDGRELVAGCSDDSISVYDLEANKPAFHINAHSYLWHFRDNICHIVVAPAIVPEKIKKLSLDVAQKAVASLEGAGVFAVELFLTSDDQVVLNEVAPRPHNSGHHTIESCYTSQYEQHLRAVLGLPLGDPSMKVQAAIMYNLLGEDEGESGFCMANQLIKRALNIPGVSVHWYDKPEMRKLRKMGHVTIVGPSMSKVKRCLDMLLSPETTEHDVATAPLVGIIMGSDSDLPVMKDAAEILESFGVSFELTVVSAHRTPERMYSYAQSAKDRGIKTIIAGAGGAAHLPGMVASLTPLPVIGVPVKTSSLSGMDSLLSIVQMPKGVPVATVAIGNASNAALLAIKIVAIGDADLLQKVAKYQEEMKDGVLTKAEELKSLGWEKYLNS